MLDYDYYDDDDECPCDDCTAEYCDVWEAHFCCALCHYYGYEDCDNCDPMDI